MRILYITGGFPYPLTSGYLRHFHLIRGLSARHQVDLASIVGRGFRDEDVDGVRPFVRRVETFGAPGRSHLVVAKAARRLKGATVSPGPDAAGLALARAVGRMMVETPYDVVVLSGRQSEGVIDQLGATPVVVDLCDAVAARLSGSLPYASPPRRAMIRLEQAHVTRVEARLVEAGAQLLFASQRDRDLVLDGRHASKAVVVPNGVDVSFWHRRTRHLGADGLVFSGAMDYRPNEDAARFLIREIMPRVWAEEPATRLSIVGRDPTVALRRAASDPRITVTGFVPDVRPYLDAAAVFVAPLRFGTGIQNKLLEAMAMEMAIVTTRVAAVGVQPHEEHPPPVTIAGGRASFAEHTVAALRGVRADPRPRPAARAFVAKWFSWEHAVERLEDVLARTLASAS